MRRGWLFLVAALGLATVAIMPMYMGIASLPSFFRLIAFVALCSAPVAIVRAVLKTADDGGGAEEELAELREDIAALRGDLEARFADVTLAIDDLAPRAALNDIRDDDRG